MGLLLPSSTFLDLLEVSGPEEEAWVARLAVDSDEVEVIVEASEVGTDVVFHQI